MLVSFHHNTVQKPPSNTVKVCFKITEQSVHFPVWSLDNKASIAESHILSLSGLIHFNYRYVFKLLLWLECSVFKSPVCPVFKLLLCPAIVSLVLYVLLSCFHAPFIPLFGKCFEFTLKIQYRKRHAKVNIPINVKSTIKTKGIYCETKNITDWIDGIYYTGQFVILNLQVVMSLNKFHQPQKLQT